MSLLFSKIVFFLKNFVSLCLLWLIQSVFRSIEIVLKLFKEVSVCFDWSNLFLDQSKLFWNCLKNFKEPSVCFDQSKILDQVFKKSEFDIFKLTFQKGFQNFFSLSNLDKARPQFFVVFLWIFCKVFLSIS